VRIRLGNVLRPAARRASRALKALGLFGIAALLAGAFALRAFVGVAEHVVEHDALPLDHRAREIVQGYRTPALDAVFGAATWLGDPLVLTPLVAVGAILLAVRRSRRTALLAAVGPFVASLAIIALKRGFARERPEGALALGIQSASFPSGHATASMASLLTLAYVFARERMAPWWCVPVAALLALVVGFTRVWLDAHWLTDVAGGWSVGAALALGGIALYERLRVVDREHAAAARGDDEVEDPAAR
jgi:membrane-associated phospholipid phosphatase